MIYAIVSGLLGVGGTICFAVSISGFVGWMMVERTSRVTAIGAEAVRALSNGALQPFAQEPSLTAPILLLVVALLLWGGAWFVMLLRPLKLNARTRALRNRRRRS